MRGSSRWRLLGPLHAAMVACVVGGLGMPRVTHAQPSELERSVAPPRAGNEQSFEATLGFAHHPNAERLTLSPGLRFRYQAEFPLSIELDVSRAHVLLGTDTADARIAGLAIAEASYDTKLAAAGLGVALLAASDRVPPDGRTATVGGTLLVAMARVGARDGLMGWVRAGLSLDAAETEDSDGGFASLFLLSGGASVPLVIADIRIALEYDISVAFVGPFLATQRVGPRVWLVGDPARPVFGVFAKYQHLSAYHLNAAGHGLVLGIEYRASLEGEDEP